MADLSNELSNIRNAVRGEDVRDSLIIALDKVENDSNDVTRSSYDSNDDLQNPIKSGEAYQALSYANGDEQQYPIYDLDEITINEPGTYIASENDLEGYSKVIVNDFSTNLIEKTITQSGTYLPIRDGAFGYKKVVVNAKDKLGTKTITEPGTYRATDDSLDGYSKVIVDASNRLEELVVTLNGIYNPPENVEGFSSVRVNVDLENSETVTAKLGEKIITESGTYEASDDDLDGFSKVTVQIPTARAEVDNGVLRLFTETSNGEFPIVSAPFQINMVRDYTADILQKTISSFYDTYNTVEYLATKAFENCQLLSTVTLPVCSSIASEAFSNCTRLESVYLQGSSICNLQTSNAFASTPIAGFTDNTEGRLGYIYVPSSLYSQYITTANWSYYASQITIIEEGE